MMIRIIMMMMIWWWWWWFIWWWVNMRPAQGGCHHVPDTPSSLSLPSWGFIIIITIIIFIFITTIIRILGWGTWWSPPGYIQWSLVFGEGREWRGGLVLVAAAGGQTLSFWWILVDLRVGVSWLMLVDLWVMVSTCWLSTWRAWWWASQANKAWLSSDPGRNLRTSSIMVAHIDNGGQPDDDGHNNAPFCGIEDHLFGCCCYCCQASLLTLAFNPDVMHTLWNVTLAKGKCNTLARM